MNVSDEHERRREILDALAVLAGCTATLSALPDGTAPDVLRWRPSDGLILVADAKATETPGCVATERRLDGYMQWTASTCRARGGFLLVCHAPRDGFGWVTLLRRLCSHHRLKVSKAGCWRVDDADDISYAVVPANAPISGSSTTVPPDLYRRARWPVTDVGSSN